MKLLKVEIYKLVKSKKYIIFILSLIIMLVFSGVGLYKNAQNEKPEIKIKNNEKLLVDYRVKAQDENLSEDMKRNYEQKIKVVEKENEELEEEIKNPNYNWKIKLEEENKFLEEGIESAKIALDYNQIEENNGKIKINKYLLDNNLEPRKKYEVSSYLDMKEVLGSLNVIFLPMLVVILAYDSISGEYQNSTIKYLMAKPIKRSSIILAKFLSAFLLASISIFLLEIIFLIIIGIIFNFGDYMYPVIVGTRYNIDKLGNLSSINNSSYIIPIYKYLIKSLMFQFVAILPIIALSLLISEECSTNGSSLIINATINIVASIITFITPLNFLKNVYPFWFTSYNNSISIIDGIINLKLSTTNISLKLGLIVCLIWTIIFYYIAHRKFIKKDVV
ncbi:ABC transporter permease [Clostridium senegalense]|uniref:ABC transporter permease subunit n=1 Tax=Clostridium senegalense TaxID=1465809 RepID=UPI001C11AAFE|nr:ABC transporter permease subunit [Clostridium senegalense]MBU5227108.1 ABC transporter permease [Clostridium senegalense]